MLHNRIIRLPLTMLLSAILAGACLQTNAQSPSTQVTGKPSYGDGFPREAVDYFGLVKFSELSPPAIYAKAFRTIIAGDSQEVFDELLEASKENPDDIWAHFLLVTAAVKSDRLVEVTIDLRKRSDTEYRKGLPIQPLSIASFYSMAIVQSKKIDKQGFNFGVRPARLKELRADGRLEQLMHLSALWNYLGAGSIRAHAFEYLEKDPDFYQLRTMYAHSLAYGAGPIKNSDGTIVPYSGFKSNPQLLQQQMKLVIDAHPNYVPAYFVAVAGASKSAIITYSEFFLKNSDPSCGWHKRAKIGLERILKG